MYVCMCVTVCFVIAHTVHLLTKKEQIQILNLDTYIYIYIYKLYINYSYLIIFRYFIEVLQNPLLTPEHLNLPPRDN